MATLKAAPRAAAAAVAAAAAAAAPLSVPALEARLASLVRFGRHAPRASTALDPLLRAAGPADLAAVLRASRRSTQNKVLAGVDAAGSPRAAQTATLLARAAARAGEPARALKAFADAPTWRVPLASGAVRVMYDAAAFASAAPAAAAAVLPAIASKEAAGKPAAAAVASPAAAPAAASASPLALLEAVHALARSLGVRPSRSSTYGGVAAAASLGGRALRMAVRIAMEGCAPPFRDGATLRLLAALVRGGAGAKPATGTGADAAGAVPDAAAVAARLAELRAPELRFLAEIVAELARGGGALTPAAVLAAHLKGPLEGALTAAAAKELAHAKDGAAAAKVGTPAAAPAAAGDVP
jgi:hypothetical protein